METPLLSVCLITYNHVNYIEQAIEGVLMQNVNLKWELIIADDYSTDGTREILLGYKKKYPDFIKLILQVKNVGAAQNWLDLITYPKSKYIAYFEGDDYWTDSNKLQKQVSFMEANPDYAMCFHAVQITSKSDEDIFHYKLPPKDILLLKDIIREHYIPTCSLLFRNGYFTNGLPEWIKQSISGDIPLEILLASFGKTKYMSEEMACYRRNIYSVSQSPAQLSKMRAGYIYMYSKIAGEIGLPYSIYFYYLVLRLRVGFIKNYLKKHFIFSENK